MVPGEYACNLSASNPSADRIEDFVSFHSWRLMFSQVKKPGRLNIS
jgi:hypothetical protein